jgi:ribosomal protein L13E
LARGDGIIAANPRRPSMRTRVRKVNYAYVVAPSRAGQGARILGELRDAGVNLIAFNGFPAKRGQAQLDLVSDDLAKIRRIARQRGWRLSKARRGFLVQGLDEVGAVYQHIKKLGDRGINVTAAEAVAAGQGLFGMLLWVKPSDFARASRTLGAK